MTDADIRFSGLNLVCRDVEATLAFYRLLGVTVADASLWRTASGLHHVSDLDVGAYEDIDVDLDSPALARAYDTGYGDDDPAAHTVVGFRVASREAVDAEHDRLVAAGHPSRQAPYDAFWGARYAIVADPDGRPVGIMGPSDPDRRSAPPSI